MFSGLESGEWLCVGGTSTPGYPSRMVYNMQIDNEPRIKNLGLVGPNQKITQRVSVPALLYSQVSLDVFLTWDFSYTFKVLGKDLRIHASHMGYCVWKPPTLAMQDNSALVSTPEAVE